jgi:hypothetical protein
MLPSRRPHHLASLPRPSSFSFKPAGIGEEEREREENPPELGQCLLELGKNTQSPGEPRESDGLLLSTVNWMAMMGVHAATPNSARSERIILVFNKSL